MALLQQQQTNEKPPLREMVDRTMAGETLPAKLMTAPVAAIDFIKNMSLVPGPQQVKFVK